MRLREVKECPWMSRYVYLNLYECKSYVPNCWTVYLSKYPKTATHLELDLRCSPKRPGLTGRAKGTLFSNGDLRRSIHLATKNTNQTLVGCVGTVREAASVDAVSLPINVPLLLGMWYMRVNPACRKLKQED